MLTTQAPLTVAVHENCLTFTQAREHYIAKYCRDEVFRAKVYARNGPTPEEFDFRTYSLINFALMYPEFRKSYELLWDKFCEATFAAGCRCYARTEMVEWQKDLVETAVKGRW